MSIEALILSMSRAVLCLTDMLWSLLLVTSTMSAQTRLDALADWQLSKLFRREDNHMLSYLATLVSIYQTEIFWIKASPVKDVSADSA